jgi:hypothetical protein
MYLLIFEDSSSAVVSEVSADELSCVAAGLVDVYRFSEGVYEKLGPTGCWVKVKEE